jgi:pimeloyl-ACP methyl ester carboxylesterase
VITPDRPGLGKSPRQAGRRLGDWPGTLERWLDAIGVDRCPVIGMSGGGPYALVSAARLPRRVLAAVVISGAPPLDAAADRRLVSRGFRALAWAARRVPRATRAGFDVAGLVAGRLTIGHVRRLARLTMPEPDRGFFRTAAGEHTLASGLEAWSGGAAGVHEEGRLFLDPWDFAPEEIAIPAAFWHGDRDPLFHWSLAERLSRRVRGAEFHLVPGGGHFTPLYNLQDPVFDWLERATASS